MAAELLLQGAPVVGLVLGREGVGVDAALELDLYGVVLHEGGFLDEVSVNFAFDKDDVALCTGNHEGRLAAE